MPESILDKWQLTDTELTEIISLNPSMRGLMLGYVAEYKLRKLHFSDPCFSNIHKSDDHDRRKKGDLIVTYKGQDFVIECKSLQTNSIKQVDNGYVGKFQCDASDRRTVMLKNGDRLETTCLLVGEFDVLAINLFAFEAKWHFAFALNKDLQRSRFRGYTPEVREQLLSTLMPITWPLTVPYVESPIPLLDHLLSQA